jgi:hypothetical protein
MPRRLFEFDGGPGDRHTVLLDEDGKWHGWENLATGSHGRMSLVSAILMAARDGETNFAGYTITELPDGVMRVAAVPQNDEHAG